MTIPNDYKVTPINWAPFYKGDVWEAVEAKVITAQQSHCGSHENARNRGYSGHMGAPPVHTVGLQKLLKEAGHEKLAKEIAGQNTTSFLWAVHNYWATPLHIKQRIKEGQGEYRYRLPLGD